MRAGVVHEFGGPEVIRVEQIPDPKPGDGEVLVHLRAAGLNHADVLVREGRFFELAKQQRLPIIMGVEGAGEIAAVGGGVSSVKLGQRVGVLPMLTCGSCRFCLVGVLSQCRSLTVVGEHSDGTYAEYIVLPERNVVPTPERVSDEQMAASVVAYMCAWHMIVARGQLDAGETLLVVGAGSGVGSATVQLATALGARVIATTSTDAKTTRLKDLGAEHVVNYREVPEFDHAVKDLTEGRGADIVHDSVGAATFQRSIDSLRHGGRLVGMGSHTGRTTEVSLWSIERNEIDIRGCHTAYTGEIDQWLPLLSDGRLEPIVDSVWPLEEVGQAQQRLVAAERFGKVVLSI